MKQNKLQYRCASIWSSNLPFVLSVITAIIFSFGCSNTPQKPESSSVSQSAAGSENEAAHAYLFPDGKSRHQVYVSYKTSESAKAFTEREFQAVVRKNGDDIKIVILGPLGITLAR